LHILDIVKKSEMESEGRITRDQDQEDSLLLLHHHSVWTVVENTLTKDRDGQGCVGIFGTNIAALCIHKGVVRLRAHKVRQTPSQEHKSEDLAVLRVLKVKRYERDYQRDFWRRRDKKQTLYLFALSEKKVKRILAKLNGGANEGNPVRDHRRKAGIVLLLYNGRIDSRERNRVKTCCSFKCISLLTICVRRCLTLVRRSQATTTPTAEVASKEVVLMVSKVNRSSDNRVMAQREEEHLQ